MRTYNERLANIKAKAKANQRAKRTIAVSLVSLSVFVLLICSLLFWPEMLLWGSNDPAMGPALQQPSVNNMPTINTAPSQPGVQESASKQDQITISAESVYYGVPDMDAKYPRVDVIATVEELQAYLSHLEQDLSAETCGYDGVFFENFTLFVLWNPVGSSSEEYRVTEMWRMSDGGISIHCQKTAPEVCSEDIMSWLVFIKAAEGIPHYTKITVEYETVAENITPAPDTPEEPIEQNFDPKQLLEFIPADIQEQICQDFNDKFVHFPVYDWEPDASLRVFGIFGDAYALFVDGHLAYSDVLTSETVCGVTFRYPSTQTMYIYADGQFYSLQEAYDAQMITYEDILAIYKNYKSAYPVYYE